MKMIGDLRNLPSLLIFKGFFIIIFFGFFLFSNELIIKLARETYWLYSFADAFKPYIYQKQGVKLRAFLFIF